jgi:hypothetical protein
MALLYRGRQPGARSWIKLDDELLPIVAKEVLPCRAMQWHDCSVNENNQKRLGERLCLCYFGLLNSLFSVDLVQ